MAWAAPYGIPTPNFGVVTLNPIDLVKPPNLTGAVSVDHYYFVQPGNVLSHDTIPADLADTNGARFGNTTVPRKTIPLNIPAGNVVVLSGTYATQHSNPNQIHAAGTDASPVWIIDDGTARVNHIWVLGAPTATPNADTFLFVDGIYFVNFDATHTGQIQWGRPDASGTFRATKCMSRNCDVAGAVTCTGANGIGINYRNAFSVVSYRDTLHDLGDYLFTGLVENDAHAHSAASGQSIWVVDGTAYNFAGDGIQFNPNVDDSILLTFVYVGRCHFYGCGENAADAKACSDIFISQCNFHQSRGSLFASDGYGPLIVGHDSPGHPIRMWVIFNELWDGGQGITWSSAYGPLYVIGNFIHDINWYAKRWSGEDQIAWDPLSLDGQGIALSFRGNGAYVCADNTILNCLKGIHDSVAGAIGRVTGCIVAGIHAYGAANGITPGHHVRTVGSGANVSPFSFCCFYDSDGATFRYSGVPATYTVSIGGSVPGMAASEAGNYASCFVQNPTLVNQAVVSPVSSPVNIAPTLIAGSPCINAGTLSTAYATFAATYPAVASIQVDYNGLARPQGPAFDIGAWESPSSADSTPPVCTITQPTAAATYATSSTPIGIGGTATDNVGVTSVTWLNAAGGSGTAAGATDWIASVPLVAGANAITVTAHDAAGNIGTNVLTVTYTAPAAPTLTGRVTDASTWAGRSATAKPTERYRL